MMQKKISRQYFIELYNIYLYNIQLRDLFYYIFSLIFYRYNKFEKTKYFLKKMSSLRNSNAIFKLGMCDFREKKWVEAEYHINKAIQTGAYKKSWLIQLYQSRARVGSSFVSDEEKIEYILSDEKTFKFSYLDEVKKLLIEKKYSLAEQSLKNYQFLYPLNAEVWFLSGCIKDEFRLYSDSVSLFKNSYELDKKNRNYMYRYAYALEMNDEYDAARLIYNKIILESSDEVHLFGIGVLHTKRGLWKNAINEFHFNELNNNNNNKINYYLYESYYFNLDNINAAKYLEKYIKNSKIIEPDCYLKLAKVYLMNDSFFEALINYNKFIDRSNNLPRDIYESLIKCLMETNLILDCNYNYNLNLIQFTNSYVKNDSFIKTNQEKFWNKYIYYFENLPIRENTYFFESFSGNSVSCNPYALLVSLLGNDCYLNSIFIVVCNDNNKIPENLLYKENIIFIKKNSDLYIRYLATAKYLINNTTFSPYFVRRDNQVYLMTWHGTPIKSLGKDQKNGFMSHANVTRNFLQATHIISPNSHTTNIFLDKYDIRDLYSGEFFEIGYPRVDFSIDNNIISKNKLNIDSDKRVILYAPTWRGGDKLEGSVDVDKLLLDLKKLSALNNFTIFYKSHHLIEALLKDVDIPVRLVPENVDINVFLNIVDILISDYSSIIFDFIPLNKPIISYIYDYDTYISERGALYFTKEDLFGDICESIDQVIDSIIKFNSGSCCFEYSEYKNQYCLYDSGNSTKTVIDILHSKSSIKPLEIIKKPVNLIFCGSFLPNGVTNSFKNLIKSVSYFKECRFALVFDVAAIESKTDNLNSFNEISDLPIILIGRVGSIMNTADEKWLKNKLEIQNDFFNDSAQNIIFSSYEREVKRLFSNSKFDKVINFDGYSIFWIILMSRLNSNQRIIYLHNNMYSEWRTRFPYLNSVFSMYKFYNKLNSVSEACFNENKNNLEKILKIENNYCFSNNVLDYENVLSLSKCLPDCIIPEFEEFDGLKFINVARLSIEKDQDKLIRSFNKFVLETDSNVRLYIVGYGPLEENLRTLIKSLGLEEKVFLLGYQSNPFYFMAKSDLFVFSSNYEGQGLVLLESMILKIPVLTTDIEGVRSVVNDSNILAVENSIDGLCQGMKSFILGDIKVSNFDYVAYNINAIKQFRILLDLEHQKSSNLFLLN